MNPKHFYFSLLILTVQASNSSGVLKVKADVDLHITTAAPCTASAASIVDMATTKDNAVNASTPASTATDNTAAHADNTNTSTTAITSSDHTPISHCTAIRDNIERVVLKPGKHFLITVDPCSGPPTPNGSFNAIPLDALSPQHGEEDKRPVVVPQKIVPAAKIVELSPEEARIQELIDQQLSLDALSPAELNGLVIKYIKFLDLLRKSRLNRQIKLARLVFVGEDDHIKYKLIENVLGVAGCLEPAQNDMKIDPRFAAPIRFTLKNNPEATAVTFKIKGKDGAVLSGDGSLYKALKAVETISEAEKEFRLSETAVEIEIEGPAIPSLVFMDLPWKLPNSAIKSVNDSILSRLLFKYLEQPWGVTVAIGPGNVAYDQWQSLSLMRTFDPNMKRVVTVAVDAPVSHGEDVRLQGIALGLQEALPAMSKSAMYYLNSDGIDLKERLFCTVAKCGKDEFVQGLQRKLLRIWGAMKPDALRIISRHLELLKQKVTGYEGYKALDEDRKWRALIGQSIPIMHQNLIFALEDRDPVGCTGSPLDLIKESLFDKVLPSTKGVNWTNVFASFQREVSNLAQMPGQVEWDTKVRGKIEELKRVGPNKSIISDLKHLVLSKQLESLAIPKQHLLQTVQLQFQNALLDALNSKIALEAFPAFKTALHKAVNDAIFLVQMDKLKVLNGEIDESDSSVGWIFNFPDTEAHNSSSIWMDLMRSDTVDAALDLFRQTVESGFVNICTRQAFLQPRLIISHLLSPKALKDVEGKLTKSAELTKVSVEAQEKLKDIGDTIKIVEELTTL